MASEASKSYLVFLFEITFSLHQDTCSIDRKQSISKADIAQMEHLSTAHFVSHPKFSSNLPKNGFSSVVSCKQWDTDDGIT